MLCHAQDFYRGNRSPRGKRDVDAVSPARVLRTGFTNTPRIVSAFFDACVVTPLDISNITNEKPLSEGTGLLRQLKQAPAAPKSHIECIECVARPHTWTVQYHQKAAPEDIDGQHPQVRYGREVVGRD